MEDRITELEIRVAYQAKLLSELDDAVLSLGKLLDETVKRVRRLEDQQREPVGDDMEPHDTRPPHY